MPLTLEELEDIRSEHFADDLPIDLARMSLWSAADASQFFESGGTIAPQPPKRQFPPVAPRKTTQAPMRSMADFEKVHLEVRAGDTYGLEFPFSAEMLIDERRWGSRWLTDAFRKSGAIAADNSVRFEEVVDFVGGGAASKAVLTVSYAKPDASLHTRLFAKMPHVVERKREKYLNAVVYKSDGPEVTFAQKFASAAPVRCAQTYFADRNEATTNYILITECLEYASADEHPRGDDGRRLPPMQIQRAHNKFQDHHLGTDPSEYYFVLVRKLGRLGGWYKGSDEVARSLNAAVPTSYPEDNRVASGGAMAAMQLNTFEEFVTKCAPKLFPADVSDAAYMARWRVQFEHIARLAPRLQKHLGSDPDYMAAGHWNLNIDNAFWWRDADGVLDCGLIDWAAFGIQEVTASLDMCLFSGGWAVQQTHQRDLLKAFADEYAAAGGPTLDVDELKLRLDLSLALSLGGQLGVVPMLYRGIPKDQWPTVASWRDGRIDADTGLAMLTRSYLCNLVYRMTRWKHDGVYARVCEWAGVAQAPVT